MPLVGRFALNGGGGTGLVTRFSTAIGGGGGGGGRTRGTAFTMNPLTDQGAITTTSHGLGAIPTGFEIVFTCLTAEDGYAVGQTIQYGEQPDRVALWSSTTQYGGKLRQTPWIAHVNDNTGSTLTAANWSMTITPFLEA